MLSSVPIIAAEDDAAKVAAVAIRLFGEIEAERTARQSEAKARAIGDNALANAWQRIAEKIVKLKVH